MNKYIIIILLLITLNNSVKADEPAVYPVTTLDNPAPGYLLIDNSAAEGITVYDNYGEAAFNKKFYKDTGYFINLKVTNNKLSFFSTSDSKWYICNDSLNIIDSIGATNPNLIDFHDFQILSNGNYLILSIQPLTIDMSAKIQDGQKNATVYNYIIQEFNSSKQVVFQWNAIDHFDILDATEDIDLKQNIIDPFHINGLAIDNDGNLLIASRHLDEVTKINKSTGAIIWRLGGSKCKNNQFSFVNDTKDGFTGFSHSHDITRLSNGNLLIFDNGNLRTNPFSRVVEYSIDETNKIATNVFEYEHNPNLFTPMMGNAQRLPNGNTLIGWGTVNGGNSDAIAATEVTTAGTTVFEMSNNNMGKYRVTRNVFKEKSKTLNLSAAGTYNFNDANNNTGITIDLSSINGSASVSVEKHLYSSRYISFDTLSACGTLPFHWVINNRGITSLKGKITIDLSNLGTIDKKEDLIIFWRNKESKSKFVVLPTTLVNNTLVADISGFGEFMLGYSNFSNPVNEFPANNSLGVNINPLMKWKKNNSIELNRLQIATDSNFANIIIDTNNIEISQLQVKSLANLTQYYWRVKAVSSTCESEWSNFFSFRTVVGTPSLIYPSNLSKNLSFNGNLQWSIVNGSESYKVQLSDTEDFSNIILEQTLNGLLSTNYKSLKSWHTYFWRVAASNQGIFGEWSVVSQFTTMLAMVTLDSPANDISGVPVAGTLKWVILPNSTIYTVQIAKDTNFYNLDTTATGLSTNSFNYIGLKNSTIYFWRVKGGNSDVKGEWSQFWSYKTMIVTPILHLPNNNAVNVSPNATLSWDPITESTQYQVDVSVFPDFSKLFTTQVVKNNSYKTELLKYDSTYYWRVKAMDNKSYGEWSETRKFTVQPENMLVSPNLAFPSDKEFKISVKNTKMEWEEVYSAQKYEIQIGSSNNFDQIFLDSIINTVTSLQVNGLNFNTKYYWRVNAINDKAKSTWSETRSFVTKLETPKIVAPSNGDTNMPMKVKLIWNSSIGADYYQIHVSKDNKFQQIISESDNYSSNSYVPDNLESDTKYFWRVLGFNINNESDWSDTISFSTIKISDVKEIAYNNDEFTVFPNPSQEYLYVNAKNNNISTIKLFNSLGEEIFCDFNVNRINLNTFASGLYFYQIFNYNKISNGCFVISR